MTNISHPQRITASVIQPKTEKLLVKGQNSRAPMGDSHENVLGEGWEEEKKETVAEKKYSPEYSHRLCTHLFKVLVDKIRDLKKRLIVRWYGGR